MRFTVATVVCLATLVISANAAAEKDENKARKAKPIRKLMANGKRENKAAEAVDDKVLAEDEGYWERFLQNEVPSMPTPSPTGTCDTKVSLALGRDKRIVFAVLVIWHNMCAGCDLFPFF